MALVQKTLAELVTISRASGGGRYNSAGQFEWLASNAPRFDYDPVTLLPRGILIEEQRTNRLPYSSDFTNASWTKAGSPGLTVTPAAALAPNGAMEAQKLSRVGGISQYISKAGISLTAGVAEVFSVFISKDVAGSKFGLRIQGTYPARVDAVINLDTMTVEFSAANTFTGLAAGIQSVGNGIYRAWVIGIPDSTVAGILVFGPTTAANGDWVSGSSGAASAFAWGADLQQGAFLTSHIPTTSAQVTRAADLVDVTSLSPWLNSSELTIFAEFMTMHSGADNYVFALSDGSSNNAITARQYTGRVTRSSAASGGVSQAVNDGSVIAAGVTAKIALACKQDDFAFADQGTIRWTDVAALMPAGLTSMKLGRHPSSNSQLNGWLRRFRVYPRRELNAKLEEMTA